jgi:hypothetical protein
VDVGHAALAPIGMTVMADMGGELVMPPQSRAGRISDSFRA